MDCDGEVEADEPSSSQVALRHRSSCLLHQHKANKQDQHLTRTFLSRITRGQLPVENTRTKDEYAALGLATEVAMAFAGYPKARILESLSSKPVFSPGSSPFTFLSMFSHQALLSNRRRATDLLCVPANKGRRGDRRAKTKVTQSISG